MRSRSKAGRRRGGTGSRTRNHFVLIVVFLLAVGALAAAGSRLEDAPGRSGGGGAKARATGARSPSTLTLAWSEAPASLDPAFATNRTAANLVLNLMDPLVRLDRNLRPVPNLAEGWIVSADGKTIEFVLRRSARWSNGEPVTARDFEYSWKRVLAPDTGSPFASELFGIRGAAAYHGCVPRNCPRRAAAVGVEAAGDYRLVVRLTSPQPWFVAQSAQQAFVAVHPETVERFGKTWTRPANIVTNGPFRLEARSDDSIELVRDPEWRDSYRIRLARIDGRVIRDDMARLQAFDAGDVLALDGVRLPASELPALRERREYEAYPALGTYYYGFNLATIRDVHQRRAMSLAVDRRALVDNVAQGDELPATGLTPAGAPGFDEIKGQSPWSPAEGNLDEARAELDRATSVKRSLTLLHIDAPGNREVAGALQDAWSELGLETTIRSRAAEGYLDFRGPLSSTSVDLYQRDWTATLPDPIAGFALWTCDADVNKTNFCDPRFDDVVERARLELTPAARASLYFRAEQMLVGRDGFLPLLPVYWETYPNLESLRVRESFAINALGQIDLAAVDIR
ncbi:MAG: peptide ABC transporter substrate-binding protein [Actinomycetota bacterium]|nr:peptide ABC transporter substrate-binding protein [Actinomycetota bacterium]